MSDPGWCWWESLELPPPADRGDTGMEGLTALLVRAVKIGKPLLTLNRHGDAAIEVLKEAVEKLGGQMTVVEDQMCVYAWPHGVMRIIRSDSYYRRRAHRFNVKQSNGMRGTAPCGLSLTTLDRPLFDAVSALCEKELQQKPVRGRVGMLVQNKGGFEIEDIADVGESLVAGNYSADVLAGYQKALSELRSQTPSGRLVLLEGPPGTGKSYLVRGLLHEIDHRAVYVPVDLVGQLAGPALAKALIGRRKRRFSVLLVIEDADHALLPRAIDNLGPLSTILNLADGILGTALDARIIATTNAKKVEIEPALLREGRLASRIHVDLLEPEQASGVLRRLVPLGAAYEPFKEKKTLGQVYAMARSLGWKPGGVEDDDQGDEQ